MISLTGDVTLTAFRGDVTVTACEDCRDRRARMDISAVSYKRHRFPPQIIAHTMWLYYLFPLSLQLVEEMLLERGIVVSYETICHWTTKFGPDYTRRLHHKRPGRNDVWHLDEVVITIAGRKH